MLFNSLPFVVFFAVTFVAYYLRHDRRWQISILVLASFIFYAYSSPWLLLLLLTSIAVNSTASYRVANIDRAARKRVAAWGIVVNVSILAFFKYAGLLTTTISHLLAFADTSPAQFLLTIPLPIGISFYTFEGISLLVDVLRQGPDEATAAVVSNSFREHAVRTSLFIAFFPHLIAGPILKAKQFYPQIGEKRFADIDWIFVFRNLTIGYFLKMFVADNLKDFTFWIAYPYYQTLDTLTAGTLLVAFSAQIFADFAGYSLIAIGLAAAFGYRLPANFNFPYVATSIADFWRRWHISLSTWLRDYLYFPLGGNRKGPARTYFNLLVVMLLGGLWHGAAWSYVVWGGYHGIGLAVERFITHHRAGSADDRPRPFDTVRRILMFGFVTIGWLLFKLPVFSQAVGFLRQIATFRFGPNWEAISSSLIFSLPVLLYHAASLPDARVRRCAFRRQRPALHFGIEAGVFGCMLMLVLLNSGSSNAFIYFQF